MKTCRACGQEKSEDQFNWRDKAKGKRCPTCRDCMRIYIRQHYQITLITMSRKLRVEKRIVLKPFPSMSSTISHRILA
jgi:hypothetical protein